jgi:kumamolisin
VTRKIYLSKTLLSMLAITLMAFAATIASQAQSVLTHHVREVTLDGRAQALGRLSSNQTLQLDVVLPVRDRNALHSFLNEQYDPTSPSYRHWLTPTQFTSMFGPTKEDYDAVVSYLTAHGLTVTGGTRDGMDVQVKGSVSAVEGAFHVTMHTYRHPTENRVFYGPDREPSTDLPFALWHVSGLDNFSIPHPMFVKKSDYAAAHGIKPEEVVKHATTGSGPSASFLGSDMRAAYYGGTALTGAGQNLGLFEYEGTDLADLNTYYKNVGQTLAITPVLVSTDGTSTSCTNSSGCDDTEQTLDMTQALGMAPGLASLTVYIGSTDTAIISAMTTHSPLPATIGCSWGWTPADPTTLDVYFEKMATQGQNFFVASGDNSTWKATGKSAAWPGDDANIVSVGGTDLVTASAAGPWSSETAWTDSGGGISPDSIKIPSWQGLSGVITSTNKGSTTLRNGPDVSANANFTFYTCADQSACMANAYGGTSFAAPMWAGFIALVNQQLASSGESTIGFLNPIIYPENVTSSYATDFHDITSGTSGSYSATTGYDLVTGWGSPKAALITTLTGSATQTPTLSLSASPTSVSVVVGSSGTSTITAAIGGGFSSAVALSSTGAPTGVTVGFSPTSIASPGSGTSTATFTVASTSTPGTYPITITGKGDGLTETTSVSLTVTAAATPAFTISASPTAVTVTAGSSGTSKITTAVSGGFSSVIALTSSGAPTGVTVGFSPTSIAAPGSGSSTVTFTVASTTTAGTYPITITGTGGGLTHTTSVSLTVSAVAQGTFTVSVSPTSGYLDQGQSGFATVTVSVSGGFDSGVSFSATGVPSDVTYSFSPASIAAPGSGTTDFNLSVPRNATTGTFPITITATGGGVTKTASLSLQIRR